MAAQLTAAFADASTMYCAWLATVRNDYEAMSKADASAMQRYHDRISHGGRAHVEHHELLAAMYVAFFEAALDAMPASAALSINLTSERRTPDVCHSRDALSGVAWQHPGCAPAAAAAAPAASAAPATSGRTGRISSDGYDGYDSRASRVSSTGRIRPHQAISGHIRPYQAASGPAASGKQHQQHQPHQQRQLQQPRQPRPQHQPR